MATLKPLLEAADQTRYPRVAAIESSWAEVKQARLAPCELDNMLTREVIYIAVSTTNSCSDSVQSRSASAKAKGMTNNQHAAC